MQDARVLPVCASNGTDRSSEGRAVRRTCNDPDVLECLNELPVLLVRKSLDRRGVDRLGAVCGRCSRGSGDGDEKEIRFASSKRSCSGASSGGGGWKLTLEGHGDAILSHDRLAGRGVRRHEDIFALFQVDSTQPADTVSEHLPSLETKTQSRLSGGREPSAALRPPALTWPPSGSCPARTGTRSPSEAPAP